ncbi:adenylylsulfate kinase [Gottschalkia purinilytica]|uniref:Adenylylsulfate kinase n=1 Tax=Gottschalkia purinilytica TaxID=1503 RepID=A0A0L0WC29_GOTPU|nr:AAA family ATPase [Gottschalkia purinilytica]KNF09022.1 adenylylsulfate kinase [Gottschalkia purinilytica]
MNKLSHELEKQNQLEKGVFVITGIMAAGKSTVADLLAKRFEKGVHVRGDIFRRMIVSGSVDMTPDAQQQAVDQLLLRYKLAAQTADTYHNAGFTVVVQDTYLGKEMRTFIEMIKSRPLYIIVLCPSANVVAEREAKRNKTAYTTWTVDELNDAFHKETPHIGLWLDSSDLTPEETVDEIIRRADSEARV